MDEGLLRWHIIIIMIKSRNVLGIARLIFGNTTRFCTAGEEFHNPNQYFKNAINVEDFLNRMGLVFKLSGSNYRLR